MGAMASQITSLTSDYSSVYSRSRSKKISKLRVTGLSAANSPVTGEFPPQRASNAENVSIWWRHHDLFWVVAPASRWPTIILSKSSLQRIICFHQFGYTHDVTAASAFKSRFIGSSFPTVPSRDPVLPPYIVEDGDASIMCHLWKIMHQLLRFSSVYCKKWIWQIRCNALLTLSRLLWHK